MAVHTTVRARTPAPAGGTVDLAGTPWPVYKLEALAVGFLLFALLTLVTGGLQAGVLGGAAVTALLWVTGGHRTRC